MNRPCLNSRLHLIPSLLLLSLSLISTGLAAEVPLRAFTASYDLYKGDLHVAISEISLQREGQLWRWHTTTTARGMYARFISNKITSETTFIQVEDEIRIQQILNKDSNDKKKTESASFDWDKGSIEVLRKGKHKQLPLDAEVYDYHSIHLLAVSMRMRQLDKATVDFYRKGKITRSELVYGGTENIDINGNTVAAYFFEQVIVKSSSQLKYYYSVENPLLPLRLEKQKPGKSPVTLTLREAEWNL
jgi:hypothetical protein